MCAAWISWIGDEDLSIDDNSVNLCFIFGIFPLFFCLGAYLGLQPFNETVWWIKLFLIVVLYFWFWF